MAHEHGHDHGVSAALRSGARHRGRLRWAFVVILVFFLAELVGGIATGSLALLSDAGHMATDVLGLGMALAAISVAGRPLQGSRHTFGMYRLEILAALVNAVLLLGVAGYVLVEAVLRIDDPPEIASGAVIVIAALGLVANLVAFALLREGSKESINVEGAYLEVLADILGSLGVLVAAAIIAVTDWYVIDPIVGAAVGVLVVPRAVRLGRKALEVLLQSAPAHHDPREVAADLAAVAGVADVHDLHLWTLTSDMDVLTAHLRLEEGADAAEVLAAASGMLRDRHHLTHTTLQVVSADEACCDTDW